RHAVERPRGRRPAAVRRRQGGQVRRHRHARRPLDVPRAAAAGTAARPARHLPVDAASQLRGRRRRGRRHRRLDAGARRRHAVRARVRRPAAPTPACRGTRARRSLTAMNIVPSSSAPPSEAATPPATPPPATPSASRVPVWITLLDVAIGVALTLLVCALLFGGPRLTYADVRITATSGWKLGGSLALLLLARHALMRQPTWWHRVAAALRR